MRRSTRLTWLACLALAVLLGGCARRDEPAEAARAFLDAWRRGDREAAAQWVHPDCQKQFQASFQADDVEIRHFRLGRSRAAGDRAWTPYVELTASFGGRKAELPAWVHLARHEGRWLVTEPGGHGPPPGQ
jgi:hypothetical protein